MKTYPRLESIMLPKELPQIKHSFEDVLHKARPVERLQKISISVEQISRILLYSAGMFQGRPENELDLLRRSHPSLGCIYPLELYPVIFKSKNIAPGVYHYNVKSHSLEFILDKQFLKIIKNSVMNNKEIHNASLAIMISGVFERTKVEYGDRGYRYVLFDAGILLQNIYLVSSYLGLSSLIVGAFLDEKLNRLLDIDGYKEAILCIAFIGR